MIAMMVVFKAGLLFFCGQCMYSSKDTVVLKHGEVAVSTFICALELYFCASGFPIKQHSKYVLFHSFHALSTLSVILFQLQLLHL